jgi:AcrR family transcriptional regulator
MLSTRVQERRLAPRKLPKQTRSRESVEAILQAAAQVFERYGYAAGTTNRIAARAGVSIGTLYQYFPNKDAILVALVRAHLAEGTAALQPHVRSLSAGARFEDVLPGIVEAMVSMHSVAPGLHRVLFEETKLPRTLRAELEALEDRLVELAAAALAADPLTAASDPRLTARVVIATIEALTHRLVLRPPQGATSQDLAREITRLVRAYTALR